jgi:hypothetical protein
MKIVNPNLIYINASIMQHYFEYSPTKGILCEGLAGSGIFSYLITPKTLSGNVRGIIFEKI